MTPEALSFAALICLALGAIAAWAAFRMEASRSNLFQYLTVGLGVFFKTAAIGAACSLTNRHFFTSASEMVGLLGWALACSYLLALAVSAARSLGALILPLVVALLSLSLVLDKNQPDPGVPADRLLAIHIVAAFLGYGLFLTACGASVLYLGQARLLKRKTFNAFFKTLPSLERLERLEMLCSWIGLAIFTVAIGTGAVLAKGKPFWMEPKMLATEITWLIFALLVVGRTAHWLNGRLAAKFVLAGAALVLLTFTLSHTYTVGAGTNGIRGALTPPAKRSTDSGASHSIFALKGGRA